MNSKNLIGGLLAGAAIGVAIGLLLAPSSGAKTREDIANGSRKLTDSLKGTVQDSIDTLKDRFKSGVDQAVRKGRETVHSANDGIKV